MAINKNYVIIAVVVIVVGAAGYMYWQNQQQQQAVIEQQLAERRAKWEEWSRTMYLGCVGGTFFPGVQNLGEGNGDELQSYLTSGKLLWPDQSEFKPNLGQFNPLIAESWELKTDAVTGEKYLEFKLKPGLVFVDGTPLNAEAVKYCYEQEAFDMPYRTQHQWTAPRYWHTHAWTRIETPDDLTVRLYMPEDGFLPMAFAALFSLNYANIYSPTSTELYAKETDPDESFAKQVGWGPFVLSEWIPDEREVFVPWDDYPVNPLGPYAGPSKCTTLDKVVVQMYKDPASMRMAVEAGQVDHTVSGIAAADLEDMRNNPNLVVDYVPWLGGANFLHMNYRPEFAPLNDTRVRRAIQYVIEPNEIVDKLMFGTADVSDSTVRPIQPYYKPVMKEIRDLPMEERIQTAKNLLAEAGYSEGFHSEIWYPSGGSAEFNREMGTIIQAQLAQVGITVDLKMIESAVYSQYRSEGRLPMFFRGWTLDYVDPDSEVFYCMYSTSTYLTIPLGFNNSHVDELIRQGRVLYDPTQESEERRAVYEELQDYIVDEGFCVPLYISGYYDVKQAWVEGYKYWNTCDTPYEGVWAASKVIPDDWATHDPPM